MSKFGISPMEWVQKFHKGAQIKSFIELDNLQRKEQLRLRIDLIEEEYEELIDELYMALEGSSNANIYNIAKEMADLLVVIYGTAEGLDIPLESVYDEVMLSNMSKLTNGVQWRDDGKILKGDGYFPPDISKVFDSSQGF